MADTRLENLLKQHRALDRLIDTTKALARQGDLAQLKRRRLLLKDRIARLTAGRSSATIGNPMIAR